MISPLFEKEKVNGIKIFQEEKVGYTIITLSTLFIFPQCTYSYTQRLFKPSDKPISNVCLNQLICPKPTIAFFSFRFSLFVDLSVGPRDNITHNRIKLATWNFAVGNDHECTHILKNAFFCVSKFQFYSLQPTVYFYHCLFTPNVHSNLNLAICPKPKKKNS